MPASPARYRTARPRKARDARASSTISGKTSIDLVAELAVGGEVVLAAQPVVPDPGRVWRGGVEHRGHGRSWGGSYVMGGGSFREHPGLDRKIETALARMGAAGRGGVPWRRQDGDQRLFRGLPVAPTALCAPSRYGPAGRVRSRRPPSRPSDAQGVSSQGDRRSRNSLVTRSAAPAPASARCPAPRRPARAGRSASGRGRCRNCPARRRGPSATSPSFFCLALPSASRPGERPNPPVSSASAALSMSSLAGPGSAM